MKLKSVILSLVALIVACGVGYLVYEKNQEGDKKGGIKESGGDVTDSSTDDPLDTTTIDNKIIVDRADKIQLVELTSKMIVSRIDHRISRLTKLIHTDIQKNVNAFNQNAELKDISKENLKKRLSQYFRTLNDDSLKTELQATIEQCLVDIQNLENALSRKLELAPDDIKPPSRDQTIGQAKEIIEAMQNDLVKEVRKEKGGQAVDVSVVVGFIVGGLFIETGPGALVAGIAAEQATEFIIAQFKAGEDHEIIMRRIVTEHGKALSEHLSQSLRKSLYAYGLKRMRLYEQEILNNE